MRGTTTIKLKVEVEVEVDFEYDGIFRQASIVAARIHGDQNPLTPRMAYASMVSADYHRLDREAFKTINESFVMLTNKYRSAPKKEYPDEEIRSVPITTQGWHKVMSTFRNAGLPTTLILQAAEHLGAMIEPVLCKLPTVYLWPSEPSKPLLTTETKTAMLAAKATNIEQQNDGSWKVTWKYNP